MGPDSGPGPLTRVLPSMDWYRSATRDQRRTLLAASLGWMLDSMDVMLYSLVLTHMMSDLGMDKGLAGALGSVTLVASAIGGLAFGVLADRIGPQRALMGSILMYSVFTAACGFARSPLELAVFRFFLGLGMGGEWATGASLVAETWSAKGPRQGPRPSCRAPGPLATLSLR